MAASKVSFRVPMWLGIAVVSALAVISVLLASNAPSARPASQRLIAFTRGDGVYVMHADGSGEHRILTHRGALYGGVAWSPDRSRLALATSEGIWVMGAAGQQLVRLATPGPVGMLDGKPYSKRPSLFDSPTWSPDGRKIAFTAYQGHDRDIWVTNADGTNQHRLKKTPFPPFFEGGVDWSPAGDRLVFDSGSWVSDVYVMRTNGSSLRNLTPGGGWVGSGQPSWKPDGHKIVFARPNGIWIMNANGSSMVRLTANKLGDSVPNWSPDGRQIVFVRRLSPHTDSSGELYVINADGTGLTRLTHNDVAEGSPAWGA